MQHGSTNAALGGSCILCGGTSFAPQFAAPESAPSTGPSGSYRITHSERRLTGSIVRCVGCGLVTLPQRLIAADYHDAADPYYARQADERIANARRLLQGVPREGRLLEIGCACGFLLVAARDLGFEVEGVEPSQWASEYARREYGLDVHAGTLEELQLPAEHYDVAVMADTLEHLTDPRATLRQIRRLLRRGGFLLLLTPDIGSLTARVAGTRWWGLLDDHYFYFSRITLRRLLECESYEVESIAALGREFPLSHWLFKLSQYSVRLHAAAARVARLLRVEGLPIRINLGDQMSCVARKK